MARPIISRRRTDDPDELLVTHSTEVANRLPELGSFSSDGSPSPDAVARCVGYLHDIGKATTYFQRHVRDEHVEQGHLTYHARLGAFAVFHALGRMGASDVDRLGGVVAVLRHHGRLPNVSRKLVTDCVSERDDATQVSYAKTQADNIDTNERNRAVADTLLRKASGGDASWSSFEPVLQNGALFDELIDSVGERGHRPSLISPDPDQLPPRLYDGTIHLWSALTLADKTSAAGIQDEKLHPEHLSLESLDGHLAHLQRNLDDPLPLSGDTTDLPLEVAEADSLNRLRESIRRFVRDNARKFEAGSANVATLTLPTGLGKTFTGLTAAYTIRDALTHRELSTSTRPRVIYSLPYTSIIEQTRSLFEAEDIFDADPGGSAFTVHHYLSDTVTYPDVDADERDSTTGDAGSFDAALLGESWRSGTVLTTFVQLFESLAGPSNGAGLKLPALADSIIVLDEPQTLPKPWWGAIRRLTELLVEQYGAHVISMTATQPSLFTHAQAIDTVSLLSESGATASPLEETCFQAVARVRYVIDDSVRAYGADAPFVEYDAAGERLLEAATQRSTDEMSVLSVCNTVASTTDVMEAVIDAAHHEERPVSRIGAVYRDALLEATEDAPPTDDESHSRPRPEAVAEKTLRGLGFAPTDSTSDSPLREQDWRATTADASNRLLVGTFTSRLRPYDRRVLVAVASVLARASVPFVFVSTQAIEAGVDISFSSVYRDIAPLDSIVQAAGRCNRSFEWGHGNGRVTVWALAPVEGTEDPPATYVYEPRSQLAEVATILNDCCTRRDSSMLPESTLTRHAVPAYFNWVDRTDLDDPDILDSIKTANAEQLGRHHLIDDDYQKVDVVVAVTTVERALIDDVVEAFSVGNRPKGYDLLSDLADLRVSVPVDDVDTILNRVRRIDGRSVGDREGVTVLASTAAGEGEPYDLTTGGFIVEEDDGLAGRFTI